MLTMFGVLWNAARTHKYEAGEALRLPEGSERSVQRLRDFAEMVRRRCWRLAAKMNCAVAAGPVVQPAPARNGSSRATTSRATTSASAAHDEDPEDDEEGSEDEEEGGTDEDGSEDEEDGEEDVDARLSDEMVLRDFVGAPTPHAADSGHDSVP